MHKLVSYFNRRSTEWFVQSDDLLWISMDGQALLFA